MSDVAIYKKHGVPLRTLQHWKNADKESWRYKLYMHLKYGEVKQDDN